MEKVLLAVGFRQLEEFLERQLRKEFVFVGTTVYREGIIRAIAQKNPDIVVIRETLEGKENILKIVYEIRTRFPKVRIVFIAGKREPGDALLANLVNYGVYDILQGEKIPAQEVVALIRKPNEYKDVQHLQPVPILDENKNEVLFEAPTPIVQEKEVIREIYIESGSYPAHPTSVHQMESRKEDIEQEKTALKKEATLEEKTPLKEPVSKGKEGDSNVRHALEKNMELATKQKIITFIGGKNGVGNSSLAFNTALSLAQRGFKTIFIEWNEQTPSVSYWYELGHVEHGIDSVLLALQSQQFENISKAIIYSEDLKKSDSIMQKNYKKFPNTLDFLFFSQQYLTRQQEEYMKNVDIQLSKELFLYCLFQLEYDFVVLDMPSDIHHPATLHALLYSHKVFLTVTPDVATIGYGIYKLHEWMKKGVCLQKKLHYIVNQFEKVHLSLSEIEEWVQTNQIETVPMAHQEFMNANFVGLPVLLYSKHAGLKQAFQKLVSTIV